MRKILLKILSISVIVCLSLFIGVACGEHSHTYTTNIISPTCTEKGYTVYSCECGDVYNDNYIDELGHDFRNYQSNNDATFDEDGTMSATCDREFCNEVNTIKDEGSRIERSLKFALNEDGQSYYVEGIGSYNNPELIIPSTYNNKPVTKIGEYAFVNCTFITDVIIPSSVKVVGASAFYYCLGLTEINIPDSVEKIENYAFIGCHRLAIVDIGNGVTHIGDSAFDMCLSLSKITLGCNVSHIGAGAFAECIKLVEVINNSPNITLEIGSANYGYIAEKALSVSNCNENYQSKVVKDDNGFVTYIDGNEKTFLVYVGEMVETLALPNDITRIYDRGFYDYNYSVLYVSNIVIPVSVKSIGKYAFGTGLNYNKVYYLGSVEDWVQIEFESDHWSNPLFGQKGLYIDDELVTDVSIISSTKISKYAFTDYDYLTSVTIAGNVKSIGDYAFYDCDNLVTVTIGENVDSIEENAFYYCDNIDETYYLGNIDGWAQIDFESYSSNPLYYSKKLFIDNKLVREVKITTATKISQYAFYYYDKLVSVTIGNSVKSIEKEAFLNCGNILFLDINVESFDADAFFGCNSIVKMTIGKDVENIINEKRLDVYKLIEIINNSWYINLSDNSDNSDDSFWPSRAIKVVNRDGSYFSRIITDYNGFVIFDNEGKKSLIGYVGTEKDLILPENISEIYDFAFYCNQEITSVVMQDGVTRIGKSAFEYCGRLSNVVIPNGLTSIEEDAFYSCRLLNDINLPKSITNIEPSAFFDTGMCGWYGHDGSNWVDNVLYISDWLISTRNLSNTYIIKDGTIGIADEAFANSKITGVTIPNSVVNIGNNAFYNCDNLINVTIPGSIKNIDYSTFFGCDNLESVIIEYGVKSIGFNAFYGCNNLRNITFSNSVEELDQGVFYFCNNLERVNYLGDINDWVKIDFYESSSNPLNNQNAGLYINNELVTSANITTASYINDCAFYGYKKLESLYIGSSVVDVGWAFVDCENLASVTISESVKNISYGAFEGCSIVNATVPSHIGCGIIGRNLVNLVISGGELIESYTFNGCENLSSITIGNSVKKIAWRAFDDGNALTSLTFESASFWFITSSDVDMNNKVNGVLIDLSKPLDNANKYKSEYKEYYWYQA